MVISTCKSAVVLVFPFLVKMKTWKNLKDVHILIYEGSFLFSRSTVIFACFQSKSMGIGVNGLHGAFALAGVMKERKYVQENAIILNQEITESLVKVHQNMQSFVSSQDVISVSCEMRMVCKFAC